MTETHTSRQAKELRKLFSIKITTTTIIIKQAQQARRTITIKNNKKYKTIKQNEATINTM